MVSRIVATRKPMFAHITKNMAVRSALYRKKSKVKEKTLKKVAKNKKNTGFSRFQLIYPQRHECGYTHNIS